MIRLTALIEMEGGQAPRALTHESNARTIILGRDGSADFQIPLSTVSRQHVRITNTDNVYLIEDLNSTHGTMLNGKKLEKGEKKVLKDGDIIELTRAKVTTHIQDERSEASSMIRGEGTQAIAARAVQGILGRLGDAQTEGPYFRVIVGTDEGSRHPLGSTLTEWTLGRSRDCEIVLNDPNVSRRHALVKKDWSGYTIEDLGSKNGVLVNDKLIQKPRRLKDRDEVVIGPMKLLYIDPDAALMDALKDVPGFEMEEPDAAEAASVGSEAGSAEGSKEGGGEGDPTQGGSAEDATEGGAAPAVAAAPVSMADDEPDLTVIDPDLLQPAPQSKMPMEWLIIAAAGGLVILVVILIFVLLA